MSKRELKLATAKDWDAWIAIVRRKATGYQIWDLINPSEETRPDSLQEPTEPELGIPDDPDEEIDSKILTRYKLKKEIYKSRLIKWEKQHESMTKLVDFIYDTISVANRVYIQKTEVHPWNILRALKQKLAPSDSARELELERLYDKLKTGPTPRQNVETWLDEWIQMYYLAKEFGLNAVVDTRKVYRDFILAIEHITPVMAQMYEDALDNTEDREKQLFKLIEKFRNYIRLRDIKRR